MGRLTDRQNRFVAEYLIDLNATQAAIRAGYSEKNAGKIGSELLGKTGISKAIEKAQKSRLMRVGRSAEDVLRDIVELTKEAREAGDLKTALKGLELEGKHLGIFREKIEASVSGGIQISWEKDGA